MRDLQSGKEGDFQAARFLRRISGTHFFVKKTNAIVGRLEETEVTNWMLSKTKPFAVHSFSILSSSSSVTTLVSTTL